MKKIILFDPSYSTLNLGDFIINEAVMREMDFLFSPNYLLRYSTHTPVLHQHQNIRDNLVRKNLRNAEYRFIGGTNILKTNLFHLTPDWNINILTKNLYSGSILLGCGLAGEVIKPDIYTRMIYKTALSSSHIHSVRDENAKKFLENLGLRAINTGCPTTWALTKELCQDIPRSKANRVVFTLTDYKQDRKKDQDLIDLLLSHYREVYFWIQGSEDLEYFESLNNTDSIKLVNPNLQAYDTLLNSGDIDFVGTRLHAGIYAMQHRVRSIILIVDNRARDMHKSYNINAVERDDIAELEKKITSSFETNVKIKQDRIDEWKAQFGA